MSFFSRSGLNNLVSIYNYDTRAIVFINSSIPDCEAVVQQVISEARVIIIGSEDNGINAITNTLCHSYCHQIYIFSSGSPGCIHLGNRELSLDTLKQYRSQLHNWFKNYHSLDVDDCLPFLGIYGFNVAAGDVGEEFILKLNRITGAKVATGINLFESTILDS